MNWLDWLLVAVLVAAAVQGFFRGFVVEVASLLALVLGIWVAVRYNASVAEWIGLDPRKEVISFLVTFIGVLLVVHLLAKALTKALDLAMLALPNKVAGLLFGALRAAFMLSVVLNMLSAHARTSSLVSGDALIGSTLFTPLRAFAPLIVPALGETKWVKNAMDAVQGVGKQP
ncbi:MAG: CvpA family protein [Flavobacteriales bacterium]|nr:CvpA family protein [Flavobacteriales bacterium]MBP9078785.1 CvpA family protein [Flavobacteriales bacterium]